MSAVDSSLFTNKSIRALVACTNCRDRKVKCERHGDNDQPCKRCTKYSLRCETKSVRSQQGIESTSTRLSSGTPIPAQHGYSQQPYSSGQMPAYHSSQGFNQQPTMTRQSLNSGPIPSNFSTQADYMQTSNLNTQAYSNQRQTGPYDTGYGAPMSQAQHVANPYYQTQGMPNSAMNMSQPYTAAAVQRTYGSTAGYPTMQTQQQMNPAAYNGTAAQYTYQYPTYGNCHCQTPQCTCGHRR
ncbi:hypothetical protein C8J56DRAFT_1030888 [Mycena floridula]|nr:hypothetical protein C8J56DRAFT_1030888 [Mycena floridula]